MGNRPGFSFAEILFAVAILGIGFIMVAALFPVAIHQSKVTMEETAASTMARTAVNALSTVATDAVMPASTVTPAPVVPFSDNAAALHGSWDTIHGQLINGTDSRYAFVPFYRREPAPNDTTAQIWILLVQVRDRPNDGNLFGAADVQMGNLPHPVVTSTPPSYYPILHANLQPRPLFDVDTYENPLGDGIDEIVFTTDNNPTPDPPQYEQTIAEGTFVFIADAVNTDSIGRVYRVGARRADRDVDYDDGDPDTLEQVWELLPGNDLAAVTEEVTNATAYAIGRPMVTSGDPFLGYEGVAQDVAVYTTFIRVIP